MCGVCFEEVNVCPLFHPKHRECMWVGICVGKSGSALVFATYESPMSFQNCIYEVEKLVDFLISVSAPAMAHSMWCEIHVTLHG